MPKLLALVLFALALVGGVAAVSTLGPASAYADGGNHGYYWR